jgi:hypothetical protein
MRTILLRAQLLLGVVVAVAVVIVITTMKSSSSFLYQVMGEYLPRACMELFDRLLFCHTSNPCIDSMIRLRYAGMDL